MLSFSASVLDSGVAEGLKKITEKMDYPFPLWRKIGLVYKENVELRFKNFNDPQGKNWKRNTPATRLLKKIGMKGRGAALDEYAMGTWTGELKKSIWFNVRGNDISVGVLSSSPASLYASTFQFGAKKHSFPNGKSPWGTIPPRQFLGFNKVTNEKVIKLIKDHFAE